MWSASAPTSMRIRLSPNASQARNAPRPPVTTPMPSPTAQALPGSDCSANVSVAMSLLPPSAPPALRQVARLDHVVDERTLMTVERLPVLLDVDQVVTDLAVGAVGRLRERDLVGADLLEHALDLGRPDERDRVGDEVAVGAVEQLGERLLVEIAVVEDRVVLELEAAAAYQVAL